LVGEGNGAQAVAGHRFKSLLMFASKLFQFAVNVIDDGASTGEKDPCCKIKKTTF
jgi:hypothetical protein